MPHSVALFITCLTDQFYPRVGVAVTKILEHFGCTVSFRKIKPAAGSRFSTMVFIPKPASSLRVSSLVRGA